MRRPLSFSLVVVLSACAKGGGGETPQANHNLACPVTPKASMMSAIQAGEPQDPFAIRGKVLLNEDEAGIQSERTLNAGTELVVLTQPNCDLPGALSKQLEGDQNQRFRSWTLKSPTTLAKVSKLAEKDECVLGVADGSTAYTTEVDPRAAQQAHLQRLEIEPALPLVYAAPFEKDVTIAIIDTGITLEHEDLKEALWINDGEIPGNGLDDDGNGYIDDVNGFNFAANTGSPKHVGTWSGRQHGTHVAGLAAAVRDNGVGISGIMGSGAKIMALNVFGENPGASVKNIANAIVYAADNGADVINMSLGGRGRSAAYESALAYAIKKGVTVFAAAGNASQKIGPENFASPASYSPGLSGMLSVASMDTVNMNLSRFSNYSSTEVELATYGSEDSVKRLGLLSTWIGGSFKLYDRIQGTSMASPVAAGAGGLAIRMLRARGYSPSPATIEGILQVSAQSLPQLLSYVVDGQSLNLRTLAEYIDKNYPVVTSSEKPIDPGAPQRTEKACAN